MMVRGQSRSGLRDATFGFLKTLASPRSCFVLLPLRRLPLLPPTLSLTAFSAVSAVRIPLHSGASMQAFTTHRGKLALLDWTDVNTDLIIPARYLKRVEKTGYGPLLFADKRYEAGGSPNPDNPETHGPLAADFPLNRPEYQGATILVVGKNFGCGSSREHAVWAVAQAGYRALVAPGKGEGFADIFEGNSFNNGLLPIELPEDHWEQLANVAANGSEATIDLQAQTIRFGETTLPFDVPEENRQRLLKGLDFIAETLMEDAAIRQYEAAAPSWAGAASR